MCRKFLAVLSVISIISVAGFTIGLPKGDADSRPASAPVASQTQTQTQTPGLIDGATNPEFVPDEVAYNLLFRLLSNRHTKEEQKRVAAYLQIVFGCNDCNQTQAKKNAASGKKHVNALLAVIGEYEQEIGVLDHEARMIWKRRGAHFSARDLARLRELDKSKREVVANLTASLSQRLGEGGMSKVQQHINGRVKPNVRVYPEHIHQ